MRHLSCPTSIGGNSGTRLLHGPKQDPYKHVQIMFSSIFDDDTPKSKFSSNSSSSFEYVLNQVFSPVPDSEVFDVNSGKGNVALVCAVHATARAFDEYIDNVHKPDWLRITRMLGSLRVLIKSADEKFQWSPWDRFDSDSVISQLGGMKAGGML